MRINLILAFIFWISSSLIKGQQTGAASLVTLGSDSLIYLGIEFQDHKLFALPISENRIA